MKSTSFYEDLSRAKVSEGILDAFFGDWCEVILLSEEEEKIFGADRIFRFATGVELLIEYKSDWRTASTGNFFLEHASSRGHTLGWALISKSDYIIYYVPQWERAFLISTLLLKLAMPEYMRAFKTFPISNQGWITEGVAVPLSRLVTDEVIRGERRVKWEVPS